MVGGRGVRLDASSRVRGEPLFLAIDLNDAGGEARARLVSAVERSWLPADMLRDRARSCSSIRRADKSKRGRGRIGSICCSKKRRSRSATRRPRPRCWPRRRGINLDRVLPAADSAAGKFLARVRWLADARPDLELPTFDDAALGAIAAGSLPRPAIARRVAERRLARVAAGPRRLRPARGNRPPRTGRARTAQRQSARDRVRTRQAAGARRAHSRAVRPGETPTVAGGRVPVVLHLLGPNYRPQQVTADLAELLAERLPGSQERTPPPLPQARLARRPARDAGDALGIEAGYEVNRFVRPRLEVSPI